MSTNDAEAQAFLARKALAQFVEHGESLTDGRHIIHYFYGGNFAALGAALRELGYTVTATAEEDGVVAERHEVIGESWRTSTLLGLCQLADQYGVEYDGWEASMTRQPAASGEAAARREGGWLSKIFGKKN